MVTKKQKIGKKKLPSDYITVGNRFRIYPNKEQARIINKTIAGCRFVWNWALQIDYMNISFYNASQITNIKEQEEFVIKTLNRLVSKNVYKKFKKLTNINDKFSLIRKSVEKEFAVAINGCDIADIPSIIQDFRERYDIPEKRKSQHLTQLKKDNPWLQQCLSQALVATTLNLSQTFSKAFQHKCGYPKYKNYKKANSFSQQNNQPKANKNGKILYANRITRTSDHFGMLTMPKLPKMKIRLHREFSGHIGTVTITRSPAGHYYASFPTDKQYVPPESYVTKDTAIGIDVGIKSYICDNNGNKIEPLDISKLEQQRKYLQRKLNKKRDANPKWKHSKNYQKLRQRIAKLNEKIANCRRDKQHKLSHKLIVNNSFIGIEDIAIAELLNKKDRKKRHPKGYTNKQLARAIANAGWYTLTQQLQYKGKYYGVIVQKIDRYYASTKICSNCGYKNDKLKLKDREWICPQCNCKHDRDINAAINIKKEALDKYKSSGGSIAGL